MLLDIVTPTTQADVFIKVKNKVFPIKKPALDGLFRLKLDVECNLLSQGAEVYFSVAQKAVLRATVPPQPCSVQPTVATVKIINDNGKCIIDTGGNNLWQTALFASKHNNATIYQNIYSIFLNNKKSFHNNNIHRLISQRLACPKLSEINAIDPVHAKEMFNESVYFENSYKTSRNAF
ncbi:hypothetical protein D3C72_1424650 [compost metagenome]